jgi:hypothetical protein
VIDIILDQFKDDFLSRSRYLIKYTRKEFENIISSCSDNEKPVVRKYFYKIIDIINKNITSQEQTIGSEINLLKSSLEHINKLPLYESIKENFNFDGFWRGNWYIQQDIKNYGWENCCVAVDEKHGKILRVNHVIGSSSVDITPHLPGGLVFFNLFKKEYDYVRVSFYVRFKDGFKFSKGGKLPGIYGGKIKDENLLSLGDNGFMSRLAWTTKGFGELGLILPDTSDILTFSGGNWQFVSGKWHYLEQEISLNSLNQKNGWVRVCFDNKEVALVENFVNYYGSNNITAVCPEDTYIDFSNFNIFVK